MKKSLLIDTLRKQLEDVQVDGAAFVLYSAQAAPFSVVGLIADGVNHVPTPIDVVPGERWIVVPLVPVPSQGSELWWAALPGVTIPGLAAVLLIDGKERLLGRTESAPKGIPWTGARIV